VEAAASLLGVHGGPGWSKGRARRQPRLEAPNHGFARRALDARVPIVVTEGLNVGKEWDGLTAGGLRRSIGTAQKIPLRGDARMSKTSPEWRQEVDRREDDLRALRRDFHRHPELSHQERRTAEIIAERLHAAKLEVRTGVGGTGVVGVLHGDRPGRTVAWRADIDALPLTEALDAPFASSRPGVMHACGHDGHTAIALTLAEILAARRAGLPGTAVFVFQPAEEVFGGA
jgi:hypothetical protein